MGQLADFIILARSEAILCAGICTTAEKATAASAANSTAVFITCRIR